MPRQLRLQFPQLAKIRQKKLLPSLLFEQQWYAQGYSRIAGLDEVGRGPLAGPVVAAAVILPRGCKIDNIDDSKRLTESQRLDLSAKIMDLAEAVGIGIVSEKIIDQINILQASLQAMMIALDNLKVKPDSLLLDAVTLPDCLLPQCGIIKGDQKSVSIAAASIVAKVYRDNLMREYDRQYPIYGFAQHKGYATKQHISAIRQFGLCQIHRKTFVTHLCSGGK
jgi:ribonuclease HII